MTGKLRGIVNFITFPIRAFTLFETDKFGLSSLRSERFDYVKREVKGSCLDIGCGKENLFITKFLNNNGVGIDIYPYDGLKEENIVNDMTSLPFRDNTFDTATLIANMNHIPESVRDIELAEIFRCTKPGGILIVTMGNPIAEIIVHKVVYFYDKFLGTHVDMDTERGMHEEEAYYLTDKEIIGRLKKAGYGNIRKKYFASQWCLNHLFVGCKPD